MQDDAGEFRKPRHSSHTGGSKPRLQATDSTKHSSLLVNNINDKTSEDY